MLLVLHVLVFWTIGFRDLKAEYVYAGARGVRNVAFSSISHEQRDQTEPALFYLCGFSLLPKDPLYRLFGTVSK